MTTLIAITIAAYLLGGLPTAYVIGRRWRGIDVRGVGSRNVGTANAAEAFGYRIGAVVLIVDVAKGALAVALAMALGASAWGQVGVALAVVAGHNFSPYLRFGGGRGVATALGVSAVAVPLIAAVGFVIGATWFLRTRRVVHAGVVAFGVTNVLVVLSGASAAVLSMCGLVTLLVLGTHLARERTWGRAQSGNTAEGVV